MFLSQEQGFSTIENIAKREDHQVKTEPIGDEHPTLFCFLEKWKLLV